VRIAIAAVVAVLSCLAAGCASAGTAPAGRRAAAVAQYELVELTVPSPARYANPFDPAEVEVTGVFATPAGRTVRVSGFYYQPYTRSRDGERERLTPDGPATFRVRFAWGEVGRYHYQVTLRDARGTRVMDKGEFAVRAGKAGGYVRRSPSPHYFQLSSGAPYFPIGENVCWPNREGSYDYDRWMTALSGHGANYLRLWLINEWNRLGLEHQPRAADDGNGLGRYDQEASWRIDHILSLGEEQGIRALMCIESFNSLDANSENANWSQYPYNRAHGGPCARPPDFFTDATAKRLFRQRLRYLVARWGYSHSVFAWEFWNEVDGVTGYDSAAIAAWHQEMARYLRSIDPWAHLITTSYGNTQGDPAVDGLPEMEFVQSHSYNSKDMAVTVSTVDLQKAARYHKPHYFGEFGADVTGRDNRYDPTGIHLHNGMWAAVHSLSAGTAMLWYWDSYIEPNQLYGQFSPIAAYVAGIDWPRANYAPAPATVRFPAGHASESHGSLTIEPPGESWEDDSAYNRPYTCRVGNDGHATNLDVLSRIQHGTVNHPKCHNPVTFEVNYPVPGRFEVSISGVSPYGGAALKITRDGAEALTADFPSTAEGERRETLRQYDRVYAIDVPAGRHTIVVEDTGRDWFVVSYRFTNYLTGPNLRVLALANATSALVWVQNRDHTWWNHRNQLAPTPVDASQVALRGFRPGQYRLEQWDTTAGKIVATSALTAKGGELSFTTPAGLITDVAYKLRKQ
jgi:hypothetical protein